MHFIAMIGFSVQGALVSYDTTKTLLSLAIAIAIAIAVVAVGVFGYDVPTVVLSVVIAVAAAMAALWARSPSTPCGPASVRLVMGVAVTGMHYTGMAAVSVHLTGSSETAQSSTDLLSFLLVMLAGPLTVLLICRHCHVRPRHDPQRRPLGPGGTHPARDGHRPPGAAAGPAGVAPRAPVTPSPKPPANASPNGRHATTPKSCIPPDAHGCARVNIDTEKKESLT